MARNAPSTALYSCEFQRGVVKSLQHFYDAFSPIEKEIHYLDSPGALMQDLKKIDYQHLPANIWPFVEDQFSDDGS